ncbi:MAG: hypothetical protein QOF48_3635 [Verrucomicrobiota bacterium]
MTLALVSTLTTSAAAKDTRCYELRIYYAAPGKLDELHTRFRDHTVKLFEKHGMQNIGYWVPIENPDNRLIYLLAYPDRASREKAWKAFQADPEWKAAQKKSEANGRLVARADSSFWEATDYSPAIEPAISKEPRLFEMRTYTASKGSLPALHSRFRDHTVQLFNKHGMGQFGYWSPMKGEPNADNTLRYLLFHKNKETADASFKSFRTDPEWVQAKNESEKKAGGSLTEGGMDGVKSVYLKATDYSPTR